ncbi:polysaccharide deacetylase family protein [Nocardia sp. NPDC052566]|uniref:polysaccharide deacetylase family protein n=1 Tax=Nocardia sp. NPDC052566 TaxID=3364330 RepID=UPI0037C57276
MDRRQLLAVLVAGGAMAVAGGAAEAQPPFTGSAGEPLPAPLVPPPPPRSRTPIGPGPLSALPAGGNEMALTIDDGASPEVLGAYLRFARDTGTRLTFFVTAYYPSWSIHRDELRPMVESGQIQLGNHTWDHPDLTKLSAGAVAAQLERAKNYLYENFGTDGTPYFRPPYGRHNGTVDQVAADLGYTVPTLWNGEIGDAVIVTEQVVAQMARRYFHPRAIVLGHANQMSVTRVFDQYLDLIRERDLALVTLNDVLQPPG